VKKKVNLHKRRAIIASIFMGILAIIGVILGGKTFIKPEKTVKEKVETTEFEETTQEAIQTTFPKSTITTTQTVVETKQTTHTTRLPSEIQKSGVISHNPKLCRGCGLCELVCALYHKGVSSPALSGIRILNDQFEFEWSAEVCYQCDQPNCYLYCPTGAMKIDSRTGARFVDESLCDGCGICINLCPYTGEENVIRLITINGKTIALKCDLCKDRPEGPICVEYCARRALNYVLADRRR